MDIRHTDRSPDAEQAGSLLHALVAPALDLPFMQPTRLGVQSAWYGHVPFAHWLVGATAPRLIVELGTHNGVSFAAFCEAATRTRTGARCVAVDTWQGDEHAGRYDDSVFDDLRRFHEPRYGSFAELMRCTFDQARPFVADRSVDLLHIDGLHTYDAVRHDWEHWRSALSDRAVVLFHDTNEHQGTFGVWRLWDELRRHHSSFTFLHGHGLGVLAVGDAVADPVRLLCSFDADNEAASRIRERFAHLGERWATLADATEALDHRRRVEASNAGLDGGNKLLREQLAVAAQTAAAARGRAEQAEHLLTEAEERLDGTARTERTADRLTTALARSRGEGDSLKAALAFRASEWERIHHVMAARDAERAQLQEQLDRIAGSVAWRLFAPMRKFDRIWPRPGRLGRRAWHTAHLLLSGGHRARRALSRQRQADIAALRSTALFDPRFYRAAQSDPAAIGNDPAQHFAWTGAFGGAKPNPGFDTAWYASRTPGLAESGENPLLHWQRTGAGSGHDPGPLFDAAFYRAQNPDCGPDPLLDYLTVGAASDRDPNPMLDAASYRLMHPSARDPDMGVLEHWVRHGAATDLDPHPLFDARWYRRRHGLPAGTDVLAHWLETGRSQGFATSDLVERTGGILRPLILPTDTSDTPTVSVIIPAWNHYADTVRCLYAVVANTGSAVRYEVLVADDDPALRTAPLLGQRVAGLRTHENPVNLGFLRSCNQAAGRAAGRILVFLNNDALVRPGWLAPLVSLLDERPEAGLVGCKLIDADGTVQEAGGAVTTDGWGVPIGRGGDPDDPDLDFVREVDVVIGACFAVRREAWDAAGGFDDAFAPAFYEEFDLAFTLRKLGWRVFYQPLSVVDHLGSNSYGAETRDRQSLKNHALFCRKWSSELSDQPTPAAPPLAMRSRPHDGKTVLFIDDCVPQWDRHAGALTNRQYIGLWQSLGYGVVFAPAADLRPAQPYTRQLQQIGVEVLHGEDALEGWLERHASEVAVIWTARPDVTAPLLPWLRQRSKAPILYYPHDLHHVREHRRWELEGDPRALAESHRYRRAEQRIFQGVDRVLAISTAEADAIRLLAPGADVRLVPPYLYPSPPPPPTADALASRDALLFVGGYVHPPNVDAARFLITDIMPLVWQQEPAVRVVLAGSSPPPEIQTLRAERVEVPGFVADLAPLTARARVSVSPLRYGAGVKGKMVAAMWDGLPIVCTAVANEGLDLADGVQALLAHDAAAFADRILALWRDPALAAAIGAAAQSVVRGRFTAEAAASAITRAVAAGRRTKAAPRPP